MGKLLPQVDAHLCDCTGNQWSIFLSFCKLRLLDLKVRNYFLLPQAIDFQRFSFLPVSLALPLGTSRV